MEPKKVALNTAGVIFLLVAVIHLVRSVFQVKVIVGNFEVPSFYSLIAAGVAFILSLWMFKSIRG